MCYPHFIPISLERTDNPKIWYFPKQVAQGNKQNQRDKLRIAHLKNTMQLMSSIVVKK